MLSIEVYRLQTRVPARFTLLSDVAEPWPISVVLISDVPSRESCFQAFNLRVMSDCTPVTRDFYGRLGIFRSTVEEYEQLKQIFSLLFAQPWPLAEAEASGVTGYDGDWQDAGAGSQ